VIFDLEALFIVAWAVAFRKVGRGGYGEIVVFIGVLLAALVSRWQQGALDWGAAGRTMLPRRDIRCWIILSDAPSRDDMHWRSAAGHVPTRADRSPAEIPSCSPRRSPLRWAPAKSASSSTAVG
jgi:hypothetical protein